MQCQASTMQQQSTIATGRQSARLVAGVRAHGVSRSRTVVQARTNASVQRALVSRALAGSSKATNGRALRLVVSAVKDGASLDRPLRVAVIGGGPSGACAAETLAKGGVETYLLERKLDNCKVGV
jgi:geranylgeranyl reductase